jgi:hypothetical protein
MAARGGTYVQWWWGGGVDWTVVEELRKWKTTSFKGEICLHGSYYIHSIR